MRYFSCIFKLKTDLANSHGDGGTLVGAILFAFADKSQEIVFDTDWRDGVVAFASFLQDDGGRSSCWQLEGKGVSLRSQFLQQTVLRF